MMAYKMFKAGFLPSNGGWLNQTNKYIEIMNFLDSEITKFNKEQEVNNGRTNRANTNA